MSKYDDMAFNTNFGYERIVSKGSKSFSIGVWGLTTVTIPHNLGYKPFFRLWITFGNGNLHSIASGFTTYGAFGAAGAQVDDYYADASNIYVKLSEYGVSAYSGTVYYRIYGETQL